MRLFFLKLLVLFSLCALVGCAGNKPAVEPVSSDAVVEAPRDSLRAKFQLTIVQDSSTQELDAVLFSVPGKRYRMELTGPLGIGVASLLWQEQGWLMTFPTEKLYVDGVGYMVGLLNNRALPLVHIHQVADIFDGRLLPEGYEEIEPPVDSLRVPGAVYAREKSGRVFLFTKENSLCRKTRKIWEIYYFYVGKRGKKIKYIHRMCFFMIKYF